MKKTDSGYRLSASDERRIAAHCRALARGAKYDGMIEAWFNSETGKTRYIECTGSQYIESEDPAIVFVASAACYAGI